MNKLDYIVSTEDGDLLIEKDSKRITDDIVDQLIEIGRASCRERVY